MMKRDSPKEKLRVTRLTYDNTQSMELSDNPQTRRRSGVLKIKFNGAEEESNKDNTAMEQFTDNCTQKKLKRNFCGNEENGFETAYEKKAKHENDDHVPSNEVTAEKKIVENEIGNAVKQEAKKENEETTEKTPETVTEKRERRKTKSKYSSLDNDDLEMMLKWKNGVGHLPDGNLKFRKSNSGSLEVITPSSDEEFDEGQRTESTENACEKRTKRKRGPRKRSNSFTTTPVGAIKSKTNSHPIKQEDERLKKKEQKKKTFDDNEMLKCETCGISGFISEFRSSGRFCSQRCVGAYASKRRAEMIAKQFANGERPLAKVGAKKTKLKNKKSYLKDSTPTYKSTNKRESPSFQNRSQNFKDDSTIYYEKVGYETDFNWDIYLTVTNTKAVETSVFIKEYPEQDLFSKYSEAHFQTSMKLECVDPKHQSHICVVSVVEVQGSRMRLHFDGWSESYDFWINCNSPFLFPCGWCRRNEQILTPPRGMTPSSFDWEKYLEETGCIAAPEDLFPGPTPTSHGFKTNMKLEAVDRKNPDLICVASVNNVIENHFLIHFDEWDDQYDYWCKDDSPFIHPVGWCQENQVPLVPPTDDMVNRFVWGDYLAHTKKIAAPKKIFKEISQMKFKVGAKLEVIDPRNPSLARVATIAEVAEYRARVHFDGWDDIYDYWFDYDSTDLHPINWCKITGHILEPPPHGCTAEDERLCGTFGCRGIGHVKGLKYTTHHTSFGCPYTLQNINRSTSPVVDRLAPNAINEELSISNRVYKKALSNSECNGTLPDSTTPIEAKKSRKVIGGRPSKNDHLSEDSSSIQSTGFKKQKRKRKKSNEVSSSTSPVSEVENNRKKPISSTHRPACETNTKYSHYQSKAIPWTLLDVAEFIKTIGYEDLVPCFQENQIDGSALLLLSQADLVQHMKIKLGPALKIYSEISKL